MTERLYLVQLLLLVGLGWIVLRNAHQFFRLQIVAWGFLNCLIVVRYGLSEQLNFYSNDQRYYVSVVDSIVSNGLPLDIDWWLTASRFPYTIPGAVLAFTGIDHSLALKTISLIFLLATTKLLFTITHVVSHRQAFTSAYVSAVGTMGLFFSTLALRETAMMYFVLLAVAGRSSATRGLALVLLLLLRSHLAVALIIGFVLVSLWRLLNRHGTWSPLRAIGAITGSSLVGYALFAIGFQYQTGVSNVFGHQFGLRRVTRIASNYIGLQFLTAYEESIEFSIPELLISRLLFSETIFIPLAFFIVVIFSRQVSITTQWALLAFAIYVGLVTNTEFNSFRQNVPLMPLMGLTIYTALQQRYPTLASRLRVNSREMSG